MFEPRCILLVLIASLIGPGQQYAACGFRRVSISTDGISIGCNLQQWLRLAFFTIRLGVRQESELALADFVHPPALLVFGVLEILLVLLEASSACFGAVKVCPYTSEGVRSSKD